MSTCKCQISAIYVLELVFGEALERELFVVFDHKKTSVHVHQLNIFPKVKAYFDI